MSENNRAGEGARDRAAMFDRARRRTSKRIAILLTLGLGAGATAVAQTTTIRVNAGGPAYTDTAGHVWSADTGYNSGTVYSSNPAIAGTSDPSLYSVGRFDASSAPPTLQYSFAVPNGGYEVRLHFAEPALSPGGRLFDVKIEGATVYSNLDVAAEAGVLAALVKTVTTRVSDGALNLEFLHGGVDNPFIGAIEILSTVAPTTPLAFTVAVRSSTQLNLGWQASVDDSVVAGYRVERCQGANCTNFTQIAATPGPGYSDSGLSPATTYRYRVRAFDADGNASPFSMAVGATTRTSNSFSTLRINAGGGAYTDTAGHLWSADTGYNSGTLYSSNPSISGTSDPALYSTGRFDSSTAPPILQYSFSVPNGTYDVRLLFAEPVLPAGGRKFNVKLEGTTAFADLDVAAEAGVLAALTKSASVQVADGFLDIQLLHGTVDNPMVSAIEIVQTSLADSQAPITPAGLAASPASSSRIELSWGAAADNIGVAGYLLERCEGSGCTGFSQIASVAGTSFSDTGLNAGTIYRYRVRAADAALNVSAYSLIATATTFTGGDSQPPSAPGSFTAQPHSANRIDLGWTASTDDVAVVGYVIERCFGTGCSSFSQIASLTAVTTYFDASVVPGVTYRYRVRARDAAGNLSAYSAVATAATTVGAGTAGSTQYQYDAFGRLKQVTVVTE